MDKNFLVNMYRIFVFIRYDIKNERNIFLVDSVKNCIVGEKNNIELIELLSNELDLTEQLEQNNGQEYNYNDKLGEFIIIMLNKEKEALDNKEYDLAYDIIDLLHLLPEIMLGCDKKQLKQYWKTHIREFSKKWGNDIASESKKYFFNTIKS